MKTSDMILYGGLAFVGYTLLTKKAGTPVTTPGGGVITSGAPPVPSTYNQAYYDQYEYPAMVAANPNIQNPNYQMTYAEAMQYKANYLEIQDWLPSVDKHDFPTDQSALQYHWHTFGVAQRYSFMPFIPPKNAHWVAPPANSNSSGGSSWVGTALSIAGTIIGFFGTDEKLNDKEVEVVLTGAAVASRVLPFFNSQLSAQAGERLASIVSEYSA